MVYYGKPSKGCLCDEAKPTCEQCAKTGRQCPGYKDIRTSSNSALRAPGINGKRNAPELINRPVAPKATVTDDSNSQSECSTCPSPTSDAGSSISYFLQLPPKDVASCHFIANYVLIPRQGLATVSRSRGFLEFLLPLLKNPLAPHFKYAFHACAFASLNNRVGTGNDFDKEALGCYTKALARTFLALKDPVLVKQDDTLAAILLLGLFENISAKSLGMLAWSSHIEGAIQLVRARGPAQLDTKVGLDLFVAVRTQMIIHSLSTGKAPSLGVNWWVDDPINNELSSHFLQLSTRCGQLKNEVNNVLGSISRTPENIQVMDELMRRCRSLEKEIVSLLEALPESHRWETVAWERYSKQCDYSKSEVFPGRIDMYQDLWVVNMWNVMRCMRIVLASLMVRITAWKVSPADYRTTPGYASITRLCVECITDIIASVPYQMGGCLKHQQQCEQASLSGFACGEDNADKGLAGYFLLWPLACIQGQDYLTDLQRIWVKGRLKCIGSQLGVRYGNMLSQLNVRVPSMLILRDNLKRDMNIATTAKADALAQDSATGIAAPASCPNRSSDSNTHTRESELHTIESIGLQRAANLKKKAVESGKNIDEWTIRQWLQL